MTIAVGVEKFSRATLGVDGVCHGHVKPRMKVADNATTMSDDAQRPPHNLILTRVHDGQRIDVR